ncbi:MAG: hypothetical protein HZC28_10185 [Spirochaetes bacterium]|nr:hypothetical protein [Spirochaetota bacterium]
MITRKEKQFIIVVATVALAVLSRVHGAAPTVELIDTPTAMTLDRGFYNVGFYVYNNGGIFIKSLIGVTEGITLGVNESVERAISTSSAVWHIPSVMAKFRLLGGAPDALHLALGFGPQTYNDGGYRQGEPVQSLYAVVSQGVPLFVKDSFQIFTGGVRYPVLPEAYRQQNFVSGFAGFSSFIGKQLEVKIEVENITFRPEESPVYNASAGFHFSDMFSVELDLQYTYTGTHTLNRMIKLNYNNIFY